MLNAFDSMVLSRLGKVTSLRLVHSLKAFSLIVVNEFGSFNSRNPKQESKACGPIDLTPSFMVKDCKPEHFAKV